MWVMFSEIMLKSKLSNVSCNSAQLRGTFAAMGGLPCYNLWRYWLVLCELMDF